MIPEPDIEKITREHILALAAGDGVEESRTLDYKLTLPGGSDRDKHNFLADVCSFANAAGGDLVYGVEAQDGKPVAIHGIPNLNSDQEKLRLQGIVQRGIEPSVPIGISAVPGFQNGPVVVVRIPRSSTGPHMVSFNDSSRFYLRGSAGNGQMSYDQIRAAFGAGAKKDQELKQWLQGRLQMLMTSRTVVPLPHASKLVMHMIPDWAENYQFTAEELKKHARHFHPLGVDTLRTRITADGLVTQGNGGHDVESLGYCDVLRSGTIESVFSPAVFLDNGRLFFPIISFEQCIINAVQDYSAAYRQLGMDGPALVLISVLNAKNARLGGLDMMLINAEPNPCDRDVVMLPRITFTGMDQNIPTVLRPAFDCMWNVFNVSRSMTYRRDGEWNPNLS